MLDEHPVLLAGLTGFVSGLLLSIPVGPVNLTILNEGARRGFRWAVMISFGAVLMEVIYCALAFTGFASFFSRGYIKAAMELASFVFLIYLGIKFVRAKSVAASTKFMPPESRLEAMEERLEAQLQEKLHPHSAFMIGFARVLGNPGVLVFWIILAANFISREWVEPELPSKLACVTGVAMGTGIWFLGLSYAASLGHGKISEQNLLRMERICGGALLLLAAVHGGHIVWQLAKIQSGGAL